MMANVRRRAISETSASCPVRIPSGEADMNFEDTILAVRLRLTALVMIGFLTTLPARPGAQAHQAQRLPPVGSTVPVSGYTIKHVYPHDPKAFTQGLEFHDGLFYEGTGLNGES